MTLAERLPDLSPGVVPDAARKVWQIGRPGQRV